MSEIKKVSKNIFSVTTGKILNQALVFFIFAMVAKKLGVDGFGTFTSLLALVFLSSRIIDFGFAGILFRELSKYKQDFTLLNSAITIRLLLFIIYGIFINIYCFTLGFSNEKLIILNILIFNVIFSSKMLNIRELFEIPFKSSLKMHFVFGLNIFETAILFIGILFIDNFDNALLYFVTLYSIVNIPGFIVLNYFLRKLFNYKFSFTLNKYKWLVNQGFPIWIFIICNAIFTQFDVIYLQMFENEYSAGVFAAATRLAMPLEILPVALIYSVFPLIVKNIELKKSSLAYIQLTSKAIFIFFVLSILFVFVSGESVIELVFGAKFIKSYLPTVYLFISFGFIYLSNFGLDILNAHGKQKYNLHYSIIVIGINLVSLVILVNYFSFTGAAIAKLISSAVGLGLVSYFLIKKGINYNFVSLRLFLWLLIIILIGLYFPIQNFIFFGISITIIGGLLVILFKVFNEEEINLVLQLIKKNKFN